MEANKNYPSDYLLISAEKALGLRYTSKIPFMNGGLPVAVLYLTV